MKLLYIINARIPSERAHSIQVMKTCEALGEQGIDVTLAVPWRLGTPSHDPFAYYGIQRAFTMRRLPALDFSFLGRFGFLICSFTFSLSLMVHLAFNRYDILYGRDELPLIAGRLFRRRIFWEAHDGRMNPLTTFLLPKLHGLIAITKSLGNLYRSKGYKGPLHIAPDGVDLDDFSVALSQTEARMRLSLPQEGHSIFYVGSLQTWKGCDTFLAAAALLPEVRFVVVGGYAEEVTLLKNEYPHVSFLGEHPYKELPTIQRAADVLVIPNTAREEISARYTSPLKMFAHMASGVPILASNIPSLREVLSEKSAFFFVPDDARDLARMVRSILDDPEEALRRANDARREAERYSWATRARGIVDFIKSVS